MRPGTNRGREEANRIRAVYERRSARGLEHRYSPFEPAHLFHTQALERAILSTLWREGYRTLAGLRILDVGCGGASWLSSLTRYGAERAGLFGVELRPEALPASLGETNLAAGAGDNLPFASQSFDIVCQLTMMSSVLDAEVRAQIAEEMLRVLRPSGVTLWYDFTVNPLNRDVHGIGRDELCRLFPGAQIRASRVTLAPPLTRLLARRFWLGCECLECVPWLRTHLLATIRPQHRFGPDGPIESG